MTKIVRIASGVRERRKVLLRTDVVDANLRPLGSAMRNGEKQLAEFWHEQSRASPGRRRQLLQLAIVVGVLLLEHGNESFTTDHVQPLSRGVIEQIVGVANDID